MRLSDAILAGRILCKPARNPDDPTNEEGCALTMACLAIGAKSQTGNNLWHQAAYEWLWLRNAAPRCSVTARCTTPPTEYYMHIAHIFDCHVLTGEMTLEQLVDYVRSIEPAEEEYIPDEEPWTDSKTTAEMMNSIKGR